MKKLTLLAFSLAFTLSAFSQNTSLITTSGEAIVYAAPDEILMSLTITTHDEEIAKARQKNRNIAKPVIEYLRQAGIEPQHIQTQYMSVEPVKENYKTNKILHYRANQTIAICITDLDRYEDIVDNLLQLNVTSIGSPQFRTKALRKFKDEARQKAIIAAKEKAELLATALNQHIGKAFTINEISAGRAHGGQGAYANSIGQNASGEADSGRSFAPGQLEIRALVEVAFLLE